MKYPYPGDVEPVATTAKPAPSAEAVTALDSLIAQARKLYVEIDSKLVWREFEREDGGFGASTLGEAHSAVAQAIAKMEKARARVTVVTKPTTLWS